MGNRFCCCIKRPLLDYDDSDDEMCIEEHIDESGRMFKVLMSVNKLKNMKDSREVR